MLLSDSLGCSWNGDSLIRIRKKDVLCDELFCLVSLCLCCGSSAAEVTIRLKIMKKLKKFFLIKKEDAKQKCSTRHLQDRS